MEDEPVGLPAPIANRLASQGVGIVRSDFRVISQAELNIITTRGRGEQGNTVKLIHIPTSITVTGDGATVTEAYEEALVLLEEKLKVHDPSWGTPSFDNG